jgi:type VI secretion system secreted protein Hcp
MAIFLQYDGIDGEVSAEGHDAWIELSSVQWGAMRNVSTSAGSGANRNSAVPQLSEVTITKPLDKSSVHLFQEMLAPTKSKKAKIDFVRADADKLEVYLQFELDDVMVAGYHVSSGGDGQPLESLNLNFVKFTLVHTGTTQQGETGQPFKAGYDLALGKPM